MANRDCGACENLRTNAPNFILNGLGDDECANLSGNTGLAGNSDSCTDLHDMNDCLIGYMEDELAVYETCDWKKFMKEFIPNVWTVFKGIICALCGLWCTVQYLANGASFEIGENTSGDAYAVAGKGVSFLNVDEDDDEHSSNLSLTYIAGGLLRGRGSFLFYSAAFTEPDGQECVNFDNGSVERTSNSRKKNNFWGTLTTDNPGFPSGGELICEFRINKSAYPQIGELFSGWGQEAAGGAYHVRAIVFDGDNVPEGQTYRYAFGQHGFCKADGTPNESGYDSGHVVPSGWYYIQLRMSSADKFHASDDGSKYSPNYFMGIRINSSGVEC